jgi:DNA topoisomerase-1
MPKSLIIVESPSKAKTLHKYLGKNFVIKASVGHVKDLPEKRLGVNIAKGFQPEYVTIKGKDKFLAEIKKAAQNADKVYLASDPDREGEAIAWHIAQELERPQTAARGGRKKKTGSSGKKTGQPSQQEPSRTNWLYRVLFNEITERAVKRALEHPGQIDLKKVNAQQARRILDRIVGYKISPLLWEKVRRGLSAGRVQSVAVRLVCEREQEISIFVPKEYWSITAKLEGGTPPPFEARLVQFNREEVDLPNEAAAQAVLKALEGQDFIVQKVETKERKRNPVAPFITSRLQQDAARKLRFSPKKTMMIAQQLYEGIELGEEGPVGLITYMRTDSTRIATEALDEVRHHILGHFGREYLPDQAVQYKTRKGAQEAHEAIRPAAVSRTPQSVKTYLTKDQYLLYQLIWTRFVASQMKPALLDVTRVDIQAGQALFRANGSVVKFQGFTILYTEAKEEEAPAEAGKEPVAEQDEEERLLPELRVGNRLRLHSLMPKQHFTQPPPRYTEALLIRELEEKGIGRPSTYAAILSTILERKYVEKIEGRLHPTELGKVVNGLLVDHFPDVLNVQFTAQMENSLDHIEEGDKDWVEAVRVFYNPFSKLLEKAQAEMPDVKREEIPTEIVCEKCGKKMVIKWGRHGRFLACPGYPECKNTKEFVQEASGEVKVVEHLNGTNESCEKCGKPMVVKTGRFGKFMACSGYPECKTTKTITTGVKCPQPDCAGELAQKRTKRGRTFYACSRYPDCKFALWDRPLPRPCPDCGAPFLIEKFARHSGPKAVCYNKDCGYQES